MAKNKTAYVLLIFIFLPFFLKAQTCLDNLKEAENLYARGELTEIPDKLLSCIEKGFERTDRLSAYKLLILTYLYDDKLSEADLMMKEFLSVFPEYKLSPADPEIFRHLFETYKTTANFSIGVIGGLNFSYVRLIEPYGLNNVTESNFAYSPSGPGYDFGICLNTNLYRNINLTLEGFINQKKFIKDDSSLSYSTSHDQSIMRFVIPLSVTYDFKTFKFVTPYFRAGVGIGFTLKASDILSRLSGPSTLMYGYVSNDVNKTEFLYQRTWDVLLASGFKFTIPQGNIILGIRYTYGLSEFFNPVYRFSNPEAIFRYRIIDDDIFLNSLHILVGWNYHFYKPKKK